MNNKIYFFYEDTNFKLQNIKSIKQDLTNLLKIESKIIENINYIFCSDNYLLSINEDYLNHNSFTDIITFNLSENPNIINADIFISIERIEENASKYNIDFHNELQRVMIHGLLHLCGYDDGTTTEKKIMREKEDFYLNYLKQ